MKKLYTLLVTILLTSSIYAQAPELMSYQAIVRGADDALIQNANIGIRISILQGSDTGTAVYTETHTTTTNDNGLVSLDIGSGSTSDDFSSIDWSTGTYYIKSETDPNGGTNYTIEGTSQLLSVPYALYAKNSGDSDSTNSNNPQGDVIRTTVKSGRNIVVYTDSNAYGFSQFDGGNSSWNSQSLTGTVIGAVVSDENIVIYTTTNAYAFSQFDGGNSNWSSQSLNGNVIGAISSKKNIVVYTDSNAYGFSQFDGGNGSWNSQSLTGTPEGAANSNENIVVYTNSNAYGFSQFSGGNSSWNSQSLTGTPLHAIGNAASIVVVTSSNAYGFSQFSGGNSSWNSRSLTGNVQGTAGQ